MFGFKKKQQQQQVRFNINWKKVRTVSDIVKILSACQLVVRIENLKSIEKYIDVPKGGQK